MNWTTRIMGATLRSLATVAAVAALVGCGGYQAVAPHGDITNFTAMTWPNLQSRNVPQGHARRVGQVASDAATKGLYVAGQTTTSVLGYPYSNSGNKKPRCSITVAHPNVHDIAVDAQGTLIVPDGGETGGNYPITLYQGPGMCGQLAATILDYEAQPVDAASNNALTGKIAVAVVQHLPGSSGGIDICTVKDGCTMTLTNPNIYYGFGVAMGKSGNCWDTGWDRSGVVHLVFFRGCQGLGKLATGFQNYSSGGLDIDSHGNLVTIDPNKLAVYVYSGCKPKCALVGGPLPLIGEGFYGHLNRSGNEMAIADLQNNQVDVYAYTPNSLTYLYSFNKGLPPSAQVVGVAFNPRSRE